MTGPRPLPTPRPQLVMGAAAYGLFLTIVGTVVFVAGVAIARRIWPELDT